MTDDEMRKYIQKAREIASSVGPMHSYWDMIADAEAILDGRPTILDHDVLRKFFQEIREKR